MARLTELGEVLFPVSTHALFVHRGGRDVQVPDSQAIVHAQAGRVLGVVGREMRRFQAWRNCPHSPAHLALGRHSAAAYKAPRRPETTDGRHP